MTDNEKQTSPSRVNEFLEDLLKELEDPIHQRIINAYQGIDPVGSMETELGKILLEVIKSEN
jgi:hypothetical protein